jgi:scyllo-inositol 2-dehydrogenase (NADP+)
MKHYSSAKQIRGGVIGYGGAFNMGRSHLTEMSKAGMMPTAVAELDPDRLKVAVTDFPGIQTFATVDEMLAQSDVNLVTIITPHNTHAKLALQCLKAGRHVVCEKPLAITTEECDAIIAAARQEDLMASTYHNRHWDGCILRAIEEINEKKVIGDVFRIDAHMGGRGQPGDWWRTSRTISGGILYDWGVHLLEYSLQLIDSEVTEVSGFAKTGFWAPHTAWKDDTIEDEACAVVRFKNGAWINLSMSSLDTNAKPGFLEVHGTKGNYVMEWEKYRLYKKEGALETVETGAHHPGTHQKYYENIADCLTGEAPLIITSEWARRPIHILDLAVKSAQQGKTLAAQDERHSVHGLDAGFAAETGIK